MLRAASGGFRLLNGSGLVERAQPLGEPRHEAVVDALGDGLSMVYSFFNPEDARRSPGVYIILDHIQQARAAGFGYLYLGYWIPGSDKMHYKAEFRPLELLLGGEWRPYEPVEF